MLGEVINAAYLKFIPLMLTPKMLTPSVLIPKLYSLNESVWKTEN